MDWILPSLQWYAVLVAISWGFAPWVRLFLPHLPDRSAFIARPLGLLAAVYPLWLLSSVSPVPYLASGLWLTVAFGAATGWLLLWRRGMVSKHWLRWLLAVEALALTAFVLYAVWRGYAPQILNTEKPMDIAFLASTSRATSMPPPDPWFSGESINYYYLGYLLQGAVTRMSRVVPTVGFNLALATTFSMTVTASFGVAFVIVRRWASARRALTAGMLAVALLVLGGNLYAAKQFIADPSQTIDAGWWDGVGWAASRVVYDAVPIESRGGSPGGLDAAGPVETINEFPAFSFVLGDLHPHLLALPYTIVAIYVAYALFTLLGSATAWSRSAAIRVALAGGVVGSLYMLNSWDFPTYLLLVGVATWFGMRRLGGRTVLGALALLAAASFAFWLPFFIDFTPPVGVNTSDVPAWLAGIPLVSTLLTTLGAMRWEHTSVAEFLTVFGIPYLFAILALGHGVTAPRLSPAVSRGRFPHRPVGLFAATILGFGLVLGAPVVVLCGIPLILAALQHSGRRLTHGPLTLLFSLGFGLILGTEFFYIQDLFANRMNTLFKIYYQAWTLFGIATAVGILELWRDAGVRNAFDKRVTRPAFAALVTVALAAVLIYPVLSAADYPAIRGPVNWVGLDGMAYIGEEDRGELAAMRWLRDNAEEDDVLLEALGCSYQVNSGLPTSGMSAFTGVPTVLGWPGHERQWHLGDQMALRELQRRAGLFEQLFSRDGQSLRDGFGITLIYVGPLERDGTSACETAGPYQAVQSPAFPGPGWKVAFSEGHATIYQRVSAAARSPGG